MAACTFLSSDIVPQFDGGMEWKEPRLANRKYGNNARDKHRPDLRIPYIRNFPLTTSYKRSQILLES